MAAARLIDRFPAGVIAPPPSKSLSHRAAICAALAALAGEESRVTCLGRSQDIDATLEGMKALGASFLRREGDNLVAGPNGSSDGDDISSRAIDCGESGSTLRFLLPIAALTGRTVTFTGRGRLMDRPLEAYRTVFGQSGVAFRQERGRVIIQGPLKAGTYQLPGDVSSQYISGLLLALPLAEGDSRLVLTSPLESRQYVDLTLDVMACFGIDVEEEAAGWRVRGGRRYRGAAYEVEPDYSQAAFFLAAAALGQEVSCRGLNPASRQGDRAILAILRDMGAAVETTGGLTSVRARQLKAVTVDARDIPDLVLPVAALCCFCRGTSRIVNAGRLRYKESDRLTAIATELRALGADIRAEEESLTITGKAELDGGQCDAWNDHRIAMAVAVAAIRCRNPVRLTGWESVNKSYPGFWEDFEKGERR